MCAFAGLHCNCRNACVDHRRRGRRGHFILLLLSKRVCGSPSHLLHRCRAGRVSNDGRYNMCELTQSQQIRHGACCVCGGSDALSSIVFPNPFPVALRAARNHA